MILSVTSHGAVRANEAIGSRGKRIRNGGSATGAFPVHLLPIREELALHLESHCKASKPHDIPAELEDRERLDDDQIHLGVQDVSADTRIVRAERGELVQVLGKTRSVC